MEFFSALDEASRDHEAEVRDRQVTAATQAAATVCWPFLALAQSESEFGHRLALVEDRLETIASAHGVSYEDVAAPLRTGYIALHKEAWAAAVPIIEKVLPKVAPSLIKGLTGGDEGKKDEGNAAAPAPAWNPSDGGIINGINQKSAQGSADPTAHEAASQASKNVGLTASLRKEAGFPLCARGCNFTLSADEPLVNTPTGLAHQACAGLRTEDQGVTAASPACKNCEHGSPTHRQGGMCPACGCDSYQPRTRQVGAAKETDRGPSYDPSSLKDLPLHDHSLGRQAQYTEGYDHAYNGEGRKPGGYGSRDKSIAYSHGYSHGQADSGKKTSSFDERIAALHQALEDGQDPIAWIAEQNPPGGPQYAEKVGDHSDTQVFEGSPETALDVTAAKEPDPFR